MRLFRFLSASLFSGILLTASAAQAQQAPNPLRLIPEQADLAIKVDEPRRLADAFTSLEILKELYAFQGVREFYDSTNYRRFLQFVAYFEKQLGGQWPELLDRLAGGGVALGVKLGPNPAPALLVVQGKDEELLRKFVKVALEVVEQELARQETKDKIERGKYREIAGVKIGSEFYLAQVGAALLISNKKEAMQKAVDLHLDGGKSLAQVAALGEARKLLPENALARLWLNLETVKQFPQAKDVFTLPRNDPNLTVLFGGWLDVAQRSPFVCAGLYRQKDGFLATVRMPRGRDGMPEALAVHVPAPEQGSLPLLEPTNTLFSSSYYLDASKFWELRSKIFNEQQVKGLEEFDKNSGRFLAGNQMSKILGQAGMHQRLVVAHQEKHGYQVEPGQRFPAFALVLSMREPEGFAKSTEAVLRAAALLAGTQLKLRLVEDKYKDVNLIGYRFPEDVKLQGDAGNIRFNFSPCFAAVGDQFLMASTLELGQEMIDLLQREAKQPRKIDPASARSKVYSAGGAEFLKSVEDQLLAQTVLEQALPPNLARKEVQAFIDLVRRLGVLQLQSHYGAQEFRYDVQLILGK